MDIFDELQTDEVCELKIRYHELYGCWRGYHWEDFGSVEEYKDWLREKISEKEKELEGKQHAQDHP